MNKKTILIGISGGIATYKICDMVRQLVKLNYNIYVTMTKNATQFVTPLTFKTLTNNPVFLDTFEENNENPMPHISLTKIADIMVIAPATANIIAKMAHGIGDDLVSTLCLSFNKKIIVAPAMNQEMYQNPIVQKNVTMLKNYSDKFMVLDPDKGDLACGDYGQGRLAALEKIIQIIKNEI